MRGLGPGGELFGGELFGGRDGGGESFGDEDGELFGCVDGIGSEFPGGALTLPQSSTLLVTLSQQ